MDTSHYHSCNKCARINNRVPIGTITGFLEVKEYIEEPSSHNLIGYKCYCHKCNNLVELDTIKYRNFTLRNKEIATCGCDTIKSKGEEKIKQILNNFNITFI